MKKKNHVNAVIIGAGAGGGVVAKELAMAGLSVILFERGGWVSYLDHDDDELVSQRVTVLGNAFGPDDVRHRRVIVNKEGVSRIVLPSESAYNNNAACVGSGTVSYGAMAWRFMEDDFRMKTKYGSVEDSTLEDWPISYAELEPFYEKAEYEIGVAGESGANPFESFRKKPYPMPPFEYNNIGKILYETTKKMGLHPFPVPMFRNSVPYDGRPACYRRRYCVGVACPINAKNGTHNTVIPTALESGNCQLKANCQVAEIIIDKQGKATGIKYFDENNRGQIQTADIVIVSAAAVETARLLLNSKSKLFPEGAGNNNGWVGHNLQGHAYGGAYGLMDRDVYDDVGPGPTFAVGDFNHDNESMIGGGVIVNKFTAMPYEFSRIRPPQFKKWGKEHKVFQKTNYKRIIGLHGPFHEIPNFHAKVSIDPSVKDNWGIPVARLSGGRHHYDTIGSQFLADQSERILKEAGAYLTWKHASGTVLSGGQHQAGTARMGDDPKTSVTNRFGQVHEIDNLFIADGSLCVTNGGFNPGLTIMALGYWVSNYIVKTWTGTKFR